MTRDDRTAPVGVFHYAHSYAACARSLTTQETGSMFPDAVVRFLYAHAVELYLKALIRARGRTSGQVRAFGHNLEKLVEAARQEGLEVSDVREQQILHLREAIDDRYIRTGVRQVLPPDILDQICRELHEFVGPVTYEGAGLTRPPILYSED